MSLELPGMAGRDYRLTGAEIWRILGLAVGGVLVFAGIGVAELLLMH
jgi:tetrahydromethanopterin S-methyltransferase subunit F